ncbi:MAG: UDP-4-amino-4,6-dideoxy-N-acetyl-beta-L-altrosamine transaminase [Candidatus Melainabacteria bacterium GWF2_37_15]|nr:MAG: UDP-4-amino-4,6-dideoxy-N-acetyl-beta-L-altrosamine transaminase [Candidatus Melainabacteria bacterium GWF2_37_15]
MDIRNKFLPYALPLIEEDEINEVIDTLKSCWITTGPKTKLFEEKFKEYIGAKHAIALNSCTAGLHLSLVASNIKAGDEVITTPFTFCATVNVIEHVGATPVLVDIDEKTFNIDVNKIEAAITEKTKAIMPVHFAGQSCEMDKINEIAKKHNLLVIEDAAHTIGAEYKGRKTGQDSYSCSYSFYATKNLTTAEGGMVVTNNDELAEKLRILSLHGISKDAWKRYTSEGNWHYEVIYPGFKYNMTDIQAALGLCQLKKLDRFNDTRAKYARMYDEILGEISGIILPKECMPGKMVWHLYCIRLKEACRNEFIEKLKQKNIGTSVHFIPIHKHPYYRDKYGYKTGDFPVTDKVFEGLVSLPLYPLMTEEDVKYVAGCVAEQFKTCKSS